MVHGALLKKLLVFLAVAAIAGVVVWGVARKNSPPDIRFARASKQTLVATLPTNGKVEPYQWQAVRAETAGLVSRAPFHNGDRVAKGAVLAALTNSEPNSAIESAEARVAEARANCKPSKPANPPSAPISKTASRPPS